MFFSKKSIYYTIFFIIVIFLTFFYYYGIFHYHYLVPPGDDGIRHMTEAQDTILAGKTLVFEGSQDPPLFHILLACLSLATKTSIVPLTLFFTAFLTITAALSLYFLARRFFKNYLLALFVPLLLILLSPQPANIYDAGTYLNIFAAFFLMIIGFANLPSIFLKRNIDWQKIVLLSVLFGAVILSHSLSTTYFVLIFLFLIVGLLISRLFSMKSLLILIQKARGSFVPIGIGTQDDTVKKVYFKNFLVLILILAVFFIPFTWHFYSNFFFQKVTDIFFESQDGIQEEAGTAYLNFIPELSYYGRALGSIIWGLGLIAFLWCLTYDVKHRISIYRMIVLLWALALFFGSRYKFFVLPLRFGRDLVVPFVILICIFLFYYLPFLRFNKLIKYFVILLLVFALPKFFAQAVKYNQMVRLQRLDEKAITWIKEHTKKNDVILVYPPTISMGSWGSYVNLLTSRATADGEDCQKKKNQPYKKCDQIYNPNSGKSKKFYLDNSVNYVYAGKKILGHFIGEKRIEWDYQNRLLKAEFLKKVAEFPESEKLGKVMIFEVQEEKIN
ncbi:MAG: hypothetical protein AB1465_00890 [Patescibacteria group bacterium]